MTVIDDASLRLLDPGEKQAIALAEALRADALIMDDRAGRKAAERRGLHVIGTLRVLYDAAVGGFLDLREAIEELQQTGFYVERSLAEEILKRFSQRRGESE